MQGLILLLLSLGFSGVHMQTDCVQSGTVSCACLEESVTCSGVQESPLQMQDLVKNLSALYTPSELQHLSLNITNMSFPKDFTFEDFKLAKLNLSGGIQEELNEDLFSGLQSTLTVLNLQSNDLEAIKEQTFSSLHSLKELYLDFNRLHEIEPSIFFNLSVLQILSLSGNNLEKLENECFEYLPNVHTLIMDENSIVRIGNLNSIVSLTLVELSVKNSSITGTVDRQTLFGAPNLNSLDLSENMLIGVDSFAFSKLNSLRKLNLSYNLVEFLKDNAFSLLYSLEILDLRTNKIKMITESSFSNLTSLKYLDLSGNMLEALLSVYTEDMNSLETINLKNNRIKIITENTFAASSNLKEIYLQGNMFDCSCELSYFVEYLDNNSIVNADGPVFCAFPVSLSGTELKKVDFISMNCELLESELKLLNEEEEDEYKNISTETTPVTSIQDTGTILTSANNAVSFENNTVAVMPTLKAEISEIIDFATNVVETKSTITALNSTSVVLSENNTEGAALKDFTTNEIETENNITVAPILNPTNTVLFDNNTEEAVILTLKTETTEKLDFIFNRTETDINITFTTEKEIDITNNSSFDMTRFYRTKFTNKVENSTLPLDANISDGNTVKVELNSTSIAPVTNLPPSSTDVHNTPSTDSASIIDIFSTPEMNINSTAIPSSVTDNLFTSTYDITSTQIQTTTEINNVSSNTTVIKSSEYSILIFDSSVSKKEFCLKWTIHVKKSSKQTCSIQINTRKGKQIKNLKCPTSGNQLQQCFQVPDVYEFCLSLYASGMKRNKVCEKTQTLRSGTENTTSVVLPTRSSTNPPTVLPTHSSTNPLTVLPVVPTTRSNSDTSYETTLKFLDKTTQSTLVFSVLSFDITFDYVNSVVNTEWTVNRNESKTICHLELIMTNPKINRTEHVSECSNGSFSIPKIVESQIICLWSFHQYQKMEERCESSGKLSYEFEASTSRENDHKNYSFIAVICLLIAVVCLIVVIIVKNLLRNRIESDKYNVYEEGKVQKRWSIKSQREPYIRYSYTPREQREL